MDRQTEKKNAPKRESVPAFRREKLLQMERYQTRRDLLSALLRAERPYTMQEADGLILEFMAGSTAGKDGN